MKMWNCASRHHLVDLLRADAQHFCHLRHFQGLFAVFQNLDEFHCCNTFEEPCWSSQKHLRFAIVNSLPGTETPIPRHSVRRIIRAIVWGGRSRCTRRQRAGEWIIPERYAESGPGACHGGPTDTYPSWLPQIRNVPISGTCNVRCTLIT